MKTQPTALDVIYQDLQHAEQRIASLAEQVQRLQRLVKYDERAAAVGEKESQEELLCAVARNTELVAQLLAKNRACSELDDPDNMFVFHQVRARCTKSAQKRLEHIRILSGCRQEITPVCKCGQHRGIRFLNSEGKAIDEMCPQAWWIAQSRLAFEDGRLSQFAKSTPLDKYIRAYKLI
jgi:hypothetical protein